MSAIDELTSESIRTREKVDTDRAHWIERYRKVRSFSETLCEPLQIEDYVVQSMPDASPAKWHLAHTSWFFDTFVLQVANVRRARSHPHYAYLFNSYYNASGPMHCRPRRGMISRPTVAETLEYRREIDEEMVGLMAELGAKQWGELEPVIELGLHHEQQHQELLLTDLKHMFAQNPLHPIYRSAELAGKVTGAIEGETPSLTGGTPAPLRWKGFPEGLYWIGHDGAGFAFDNEGPRHREFLNAFQLASRLVTNKEYLEFMQDGGYQRPELWLSLGWFTLNENKWTAPLYWEQQDQAWWNFTLSGFRPVALAEPVCHLSYFEADAYARWAGARLPTEAEWEVASAGLPLTGNFVETGHFHPQPANAPNFGKNNTQTDTRPLAQVFGDLWEWTRSSYSPYPGYTPPAGAIGEYNGKFMCNQYVLRSGSCATSQTHIRRTYRNFFAPDKRWQFMGLRLARDERTAQSTNGQ